MDKYEKEIKDTLRKKYPNFRIKDARYYMHKVMGELTLMEYWSDIKLTDDEEYYIDQMVMKRWDEEQKIYNEKLEKEKQRV